MQTRVRESLLCWLLRAAKLLDRRRPAPAELGGPAIGRILAVSCTAIGDTLMSTPAVRSLRVAYPGAYIALLVDPAYRDLFAVNPDVDELIPYRGRWKGFVRTARALRTMRFDLVAIFHGNEPQVTPLAYLSGARWRFKLPAAGRFGFLLSNDRAAGGASDTRHAILKRMAVARLAGGREVEPRLILPLLQAHVQRLALRLSERWGIDANVPVLGFQVGASSRNRRWRAERYAELGRRLLARERELRIVVTGSPAERGLAEDIAAQIGSPRVAVTAGEVPLAEMPALVRRMRALVTPDTGTMHLAVAVGTPVIAMFGSADHRRTGPLQDPERHAIIQKWRTCDPCLDRRCPYVAPPCMDNIAVDEVEAACLRYLIRLPEATALVAREAP